jgi:putative heme iron utilization protein
LTTVKPPATPANATDGTQQGQSATVKVSATEIQSQLRGKSVQDLISEWTLMFQQDLKQFHSKAAEIARLDTQLIDQSDKVLFVLLVYWLQFEVISDC